MVRGQHENDPGPAKHWRIAGEYFVDVLYNEAPDVYHEHPQAAGDWDKEPEVREAGGPVVAELARVETLLADEGRALNAHANALFVDAVGDNLMAALSVLERRANGDCSRRNTPDTFRPLTEGPGRASGGVSCWELFEAFVTATKSARGTVSRWRCVFLEMQREFAEVGADGVTEDAACRWMHGLITEKRRHGPRDLACGIAARVWLGTLAQEVHMDVPRRFQTREDGRSFTPAEASTILKASLAYAKPATPTHRARRWVPWLCAYSGARAEPCGTVEYAFDPRTDLVTERAGSPALARQQKVAKP
jgi:hypothetical protein